ncbi:MAG: MFS transporter [Eggerthellaceae bacterium]|nr:MFS transporter [Eggerthellaceae bacterium]
MDDEEGQIVGEGASGEKARDIAGSEASSDAPSVALSSHMRHVVLGIMMMGTGAACISQSMMISALPAIMGEFSVDATFGQLLTTAYIFTLGLISAISAFLINRVNAKTLFLAAIGIFIAGCVAALIAPNYWLLLAARLFQSGGAGILLPLIQVVALSVYPKSEYGKAMGIVGVIIGFAPAIGPSIAGFLIDFWGWRSVFVLLGVVAVLPAAVSLPLLPRGIVPPPAHREKFDPLSTILYVAGLVGVLVAVTIVESSGDIALAGAILAASIVAIALFVRRQLHSDDPLLKLSCFRNRTFAVSALLVLIGHIAFMTGSVMVPLFVQDIQMDSATVSGLTILPGAVLLGFLNPVTGRYLDHHGPRALVAVGCVVLVLGTLAFVPLGQETPEWVVTLLYGLRTVGVACLMMPLTAYGCAALPVEDLAQGNAIVTSIRQIFGSLSCSVFIAVMSANSSSPLGVDAHGFGVSFTVLAAVIGIGCVAGLALLPRKRGSSA